MTNCSAIELLLPWYVNGTLNEAEMDRVNRHLQDCASCSATVQREVLLARAIRHDPPGLDSLAGGRPALVDVLSSERSFERRPFRRRPPTVPAVLVVLTLAMAAGLALLDQHLDRPQYRVMTSSGAADGPVIQVMFEPETPEHLIRDVLLGSGGTLVAGPTATGIYRIALPSEGDPRDLVARLERSPVVRWTTLEQP